MVSGVRGWGLARIKDGCLQCCPAKFRVNFATAGAARLASAPPYGIGVKQKEAPLKEPDWEAALRAGAVWAPRLLATDLASL